MFTDEPLPSIYSFSVIIHHTGDAWGDMTTRKQMARRWERRLLRGSSLAVRSLFPSLPPSLSRASSLRSRRSALTAAGKRVWSAFFSRSLRATPCPSCGRRRSRPKAEKGKWKREKELFGNKEECLDLGVPVTRLDPRHSEREPGFRNALEFLCLRFPDTLLRSAAMRDQTPYVDALTDDILSRVNIT